MATSGQQWGYGLPDQPVAPTPAPAEGRPHRIPRLGELRGDLMGGATAALLTIPVSVGYGLLALSPLGDGYVATAVLAGLYAPVLGCLVAVLLGANTTMIYSPRSIVTFLIGAILLHSIVNSTVPALRGASPAALLVLCFFLVFLAGAFQALLGLVRFGNLVKFIPAPVIAGFQNAAAVLIFCSQLKDMFGFSHPVPILNIPFNLGSAQPLTLLVGVITVALILRGARVTKLVPPTILGLLGGIASYYLLVLLGLGAHLGPVLGPIPFSVPTPQFLFEFGRLAADPQFLQVAPLLVAGAASLAVVASLDGLLCARLVQSDTGTRIQGNRELVRLGIGNMAAASFGGIANGINLGSSFANHRSGARTPFSLVVHSAVIILAVAAFTPVIVYMPRVVIAGMLVAVAIQLVDRWTLQIVKKLLARDFASAQSVLLDLLIIMIVAVVAIALDIVIAVVIGFAVTVLFFLFRMSKSVIRRAYRCDEVHSRKTREPALMEVVAAHGAQILVLELEGPIFFGTAENLAAYLESAGGDGVSYVILDLKRVNEIDSTGAKTLLAAHDRLTREGKHLLISSIPDQPPIADFLKDMGVATALTRGRIFPDVDRAIEWAEEHLLLARLGDVESGTEFPFARLDVFARMSEDELAVMKSALTRRAYREGEVIFREGDTSDELYTIAKGSASVRLRLSGSDRETRLITFSPGTVFGEVALLDREARSATVEADEELVCYVLTRENFDKLTAEHPAVAIKLLTNLGREISGRLRRANRTIYQLAS
jgi:MFS superfamily sulfate permease-like transporter